MRPKSNRTCVASKSFNLKCANVGSRVATVTQPTEAIGAGTAYSLLR
jgi:hypothetical protein